MTSKRETEKKLSRLDALLRSRAKTVIELAGKISENADAIRLVSEEYLQEREAGKEYPALRLPEIASHEVRVIADHLGQLHEELYAMTIEGMALEGFYGYHPYIPGAERRH